MDALPKEILERIISHAVKDYTIQRSPRTFLEKRKFATYNFVSKAFNDACFTAVIPTLQLWIPKFDDSDEIPYWLQQVAIPPPGQIRHIQCSNDTWAMIEEHLTETTNSFSTDAARQTIAFAVAFCRLQSIHFLVHWVDNLRPEDLQTSVLNRAFRDQSGFNFWKPSLPMSEFLGMVNFITRQRDIAGLKPCCNACALTVAQNLDNQPKLSNNITWALLELAEEGMLPRGRRSNLLTHQLITSCPQNINVFAHKRQSYMFEDADINVYVFPHPKTMTINAIRRATSYEKLGDHAISGISLPDTSKGFDHVREYVEMLTVRHLYENAMISAVPDDLSEALEKGEPWPVADEEAIFQEHKSWWWKDGGSLS